MQNFAKIFGANVRHAFNEKVANTLVSRGQIHPMLAEQLQHVGFHVADFAPIAGVYELHADMAADDGTTYTKRQAKIVTELAIAIAVTCGQSPAFTRPTWAETKPRKATVKTSTLDLADVLGALAKFDSETLSLVKAEVDILVLLKTEVDKLPDYAAPAYSPVPALM